MLHLPCSSLLLFLLSAAANVVGLAQCGLEVMVQPVTAPVVHGEGPFWDSRLQVLYFVDITSQTLNLYRPTDATVHSLYIEGGPISPVIPTDKLAEFIVGRGLELVSFMWDGLSATTRSPFRVLTSVDKDKPKNRFNDGKADASGRLWVGTMGPEDPDLKLHQGSLYSFLGSQNFTPVKQVSPVSVSNGLAWNSNDTIMYYIDSPTRNVEAFDFDLQRGTLKNRRVIFSLDTHNITGVPDGMAIDEHDNIWVAVYNGGRVLHIDPSTGALLKTIIVPATHVTSCAFGGPDMTTLYVTTSRRGLTKQQLKAEPSSGAVFAILNMGIRGQKKSNTAKT